MAASMNKSAKSYSSEVLDFAVYLGMDPQKDVGLLWIAEECLNAELPPQWSEHTSSRGDVYFYNSETDESTVDHPLEGQYRQMYMAEKRKQLEEEQEQEHQREIDELRQSPGGRSMRGGDDTFDGGSGDPRAVPISHQEVSEMAAYYEVDETNECALLQLVREAVLCPLPWMYQEVLDRNGNPYFYNAVTDESQREHPLDEYWREKITDLRLSLHRAAHQQHQWQIFFTSNGLPTFYNFATKEESRDPPEGIGEEAIVAQMREDIASRQLQPLGRNPNMEAGSGEEDEGEMGREEGEDPYEGIDDHQVHEMAELLDMRPSDPRLQKFMRELEEDKKRISETGKAWTTERYDSRRIDCKAPKMRPKPAPPSPPLLVFFAWWFEEGVKKYMELRYDMKAKVFHIILNKSVALRDVKIAGRDGEILQCWDLFVGQKMDVLGKPTTLMQANQATLLWLAHHARRLLKKALELENEIMQFKPIPDIIHRMLNTKSLSDGSVSLRWIMKHISMLTTQLYRIKPSTAK